MSFSKWRFSNSRKQSPSSSGDIDATMTSSSPMSTPMSPTSSGSNSNRSSKSSLSSSPFSWFRSPNRPKKRKSTISRDDPAFARLHKPFTPQNLEHQRMFESFEWNFGSSDGDDDSYRRRRSSLSISPCATRNMTVDDCTRQDPYSHDGSSQDTLSSAFASLSTREARGEGYGQTTVA
ncbi:hypothetical protein F5B22DRAFT_299297 [Xylaria bambusicola]|uniref:uncharacterized protein n=1 Tax=Xylaria bambusicola TaxID=326684 RepID=UPI002008A339|nr:uncharacterized protein F5B22DRAFT_299297 [Xylaria bambusicola]KAI0512626.1 hypothetical protein F5B22DRAFT_299297 [Xylaria bambusicola]